MDALQSVVTARLKAARNRIATHVGNNHNQVIATRDRVEARLRTAATDTVGRDISARVGALRLQMVTRLRATSKIIRVPDMLANNFAAARSIMLEQDRKRRRLLAIQDRIGEPLPDLRTLRVRIEHRLTSPRLQIDAALLTRIDHVARCIAARQALAAVQSRLQTIVASMPDLLALQARVADRLKSRSTAIRDMTTVITERIEPIGHKRGSLAASAHMPTPPPVQPVSKPTTAAHVTKRTPTPHRKAVERLRAVLAERTPEADMDISVPARPAGVSDAQQGELIRAQRRQLRKAAKRRERQVADARLKDAIAGLIASGTVVTKDAKGWFGVDTSGLLPEERVVFDRQVDEEHVQRWLGGRYGVQRPPDQTAMSSRPGQPAAEEDEHLNLIRCHYARNRRDRGDGVT